MSDHDLGKAELEFVGSLAAPLFWVMRRCDGRELVKIGSVFFLNTGVRLFAVTAAHVVIECLNDTKSSQFVQSMIGANGGPALSIYLGDRIIDGSPEIDIATFRITAEEVERIGRTQVSGFQRAWPPPPARVDHGVTLCGFPGEARRWLATRQLSFGCTPTACVVTNSHSAGISVQLERDRLLRVLGDRDLPEDYDFGGISGGPMLAMVERDGIRGWTPVRVIFEGPNPSPDPTQAIQGLEIIRARPINFINADGTLDLSRWQRDGQPL
jgi:hypothetical protein